MNDTQSEELRVKIRDALDKWFDISPREADIDTLIPVIEELIALHTKDIEWRAKEKVLLELEQILPKFADGQKELTPEQAKILNEDLFEMVEEGLQIQPEQLQNERSGDERQ